MATLISNIDDELLRLLGAILPP